MRTVTVMEKSDVSAKEEKKEQAQKAIFAAEYNIYLNKDEHVRAPHLDLQNKIQIESATTPDDKKETVKEKEKEEEEEEVCSTVSEFVEQFKSAKICLQYAAVHFPVNEYAEWKAGVDLVDKSEEAKKEILKERSGEYFATIDKYIKYRLGRKTRRKSNCVLMYGVYRGELMKLLEFKGNYSMFWTVARKVQRALCGLPLDIICMKEVNPIRANGVRTSRYLIPLFVIPFIFMMLPDEIKSSIRWFEKMYIEVSEYLRIFNDKKDYEPVNSDMAAQMVLFDAAYAKYSEYMDRTIKNICDINSAVGHMIIRIKKRMDSADSVYVDVVESHCEVLERLVQMEEDEKVREDTLAAYGEKLEKFEQRIEQRKEQEDREREEKEKQTASLIKQHEDRIVHLEKNIVHLKEVITQQDKRQRQYEEIISQQTKRQKQQDERLEQQSREIASLNANMLQVLARCAKQEQVTSTLARRQNETSSTVSSMYAVQMAITTRLAANRREK